MPRPTLNILLGPKPDQLEQRAASELQRYVRELFGFKPRLIRRPPKSGHVMVLGTRSSNPLLRETRKLGPQDYAICNPSSKRLEICGGSPVALLWGTYEVIAEWGVTYLVQGDVMPEPERVGPFRLPRLDVVRRPVFEQRTFRIVNDMLNSGVLWSLKDNEQLFDQLVKLRFNSVYATTYPHQPWCHWSFRGVERHSIDFQKDGKNVSVKIEGLLDQAVVGVDSMSAEGDCIALDNTAHPVNKRLNLASATRNVINAFGIDWREDSDRTNGHFASFEWQGEAA